VAVFRRERFDYVIDLHKTLRSYWLRIMLWRKTLTFRKLSVEKLLLTRFGVDLMPENIHIVERNLKAVRSLGVFSDGRPVDYYIAPSEEVSLYRLPENFRNGYLAFVIGGQHFTKRLPLRKIVQICKALEKPVVLLGGPEDRETGEQVALEAGGNVLNQCGALSFNQSVSLIRQAAAVIAHDTGLMHITGAFNKPVVSVWGATSPGKFGVWPYLNSDRVEAEVSGLKCHPCSNFGSAKCPAGHFLCMNNQDEAMIVKESLRMFGSADKAGDKHKQ